MAVTVTTSDAQVVFSERNPLLLPGPPVASAQFDRDKLKCMLCCTGCCCNREAAVNRTFFDVHTDGVYYNFPFIAGCCCTVFDNPGIVHWDRQWFAKPVTKTGVCAPTPHLCPMGIGGCCGESVGFSGGCCGCSNTTAAPGQCGSGMGCCACCAVGIMTAGLGIFYLIATSICPAVCLCGLQVGEGERIATVINEQVNAYRQRQAGGPQHAPMGHPVQAAP